MILLILNLQQSKKMQKLRTKSQVRLYDKDILPSLKANSASFMGRTIVPISKFDLDNNLVLRQQKKLKIMSKIQVSQNTIKQKPKIKRNFLQGSLPAQYMYKLSTSDSKRQISNDNFQEIMQRNPSKNLVNVQPSKTSSKNYGFIKGYAANSHPGLYNLTNEDRICIVTNLNKTNVKIKQISFFSIYDGSNGLLKTDYFRDNFHLILNSNQQLTVDPQKAIRDTIQKIQRNLSNNLMYIQDVSKVGYALLVTIGQFGYIVVCGACKVVICKKFGEQLDKVSVNSVSNAVSKVEHAKKMFLKKQDFINISIKKINLQSDLDFIVLGSEGLFQCLKQQQIAKKLWFNILKNKYTNIHSCLGQATLNILNTVFGLHSTKNASLIMLGLKNIQQCFKATQKLYLPHVDQ